MKTKAILLAVLLSAGTLFSSCQKEDEPKPKSTEDAVYPDDDQSENTTEL